MAVTKTVFESGISPQEFIDQMEVNQERFQTNLEEAQISDDDLAFFAKHPVKIAAIGEDWCTDVIQFLPVIIKLAEQSDHVDLKIFLRDSTDLINDYLNQGEFKSIPVFVLLDEDFNEYGHFIERPAKVTQLMASETRRFAQENSDLEGINRSYEHMADETRQKVRENSARFRWDNMHEWNRIFLEDIKDLVQSGVAVSAN